MLVQVGDYGPPVPPQVDLSMEQMFHSHASRLIGSSTRIEFNPLVKYIFKNTLKQAKGTYLPTSRFRCQS